MSCKLQALEEEFYVASAPFYPYIYKKYKQFNLSCFFTHVSPLDLYKHGSLCSLVLYKEKRQKRKRWMYYYENSFCVGCNSVIKIFPQEREIRTQASAKKKERMPSFMAQKRRIVPILKV